jgi:hypothetical protein
VGIKTAFDSSIGLPNKSTNVLRMLLLLMPAEVRSSFIIFFVRYACCCLMLEEVFAMTAVTDILIISLRIVHSFIFKTKRSS